MGEETEIVETGGGRRQVRRVAPDGWTAEKKKLFLAHLAQTLNVTASARAARMSARLADGDGDR